MSRSIEEDIIFLHDLLHLISPVALKKKLVFFLGADTMIEQ